MTLECNTQVFKLRLNNPCTISLALDFSVLSNWNLWLGWLETDLAPVSQDLSSTSDFWGPCAKIAYSCLQTSQAVHDRSFYSHLVSTPQMKKENQDWGDSRMTVHIALHVEDLVSSLDTKWSLTISSSTSDPTHLAPSGPWTSQDGIPKNQQNKTDLLNIITTKSISRKL